MNKNTLTVVIFFGLNAFMGNFNKKPGSDSTIKDYEDGLLGKSFPTADANGILMDTAFPRSLRAITTLDVALS
jgi:hypothetical protein